MQQIKTRTRADETDKKVGEKIRRRRIIMGFSQDHLAMFSGVSIQQIQKYEKGTNRVSAGRLRQLSCALKVDINYFFEETFPDKELLQFSDKELLELNNIKEAEAIKILKYFSQIDVVIRKSIIELIKNIAAGHNNFLTANSELMLKSSNNK